MQYPMVFKYTDQLETKRWKAIVVARGRCLMEFRDDEWWVEAVEPGGFTAHASLPAIAVQEFRRSWRNILDAIAGDAKTLELFRQSLEVHFGQISEPAERDWNEARTAIREGAAVESPFDQLPREEREIVMGFAIYVPDDSAALAAHASIDQHSLPTLRAA